MREPLKTPVDLCHVQRLTAANHGSMQDFMAAVKDAERRDRKRRSLCRCCHYVRGRIGGSTTTAALCGMRDAEMRFANTCVDVLCPACAKEHDLCKHCGGDMDDRNRRKL